MEIPEKFPEVIRDFLADLSVAFPEYVYLWEGWTKESEMTPLYQYCLTIYPERFFDILYQNADIFAPESETNTFFLPNVEFKMLYTAPGISETTKQALWKYLQLVLVTVMGSVKSPASFGDTAGLFEGIQEEELQKKLGETIQGLTDFFKGLSKDGTQEGMDEAFDKMFSNASGSEGGDVPSEGSPEGAMPNADDLHNHLKSLFDGKIGALAKELAEEMSGEVMDMFGQGEEVKDTSEVIKQMMKNPKKIMELVKKIGTKLDDKMKSGAVSQEELMKEASEMISKMKGGAGGKEFQDMMKDMMKTMGSSGKGMMGKMTAMMGQTAQKERMRAKLEQKKFTLESKSTNEFVFKMPEEGVQEKSIAPVKPEVKDDWLEDVPSSSSGPKKGKKKGKKGGK